MIRTPFFRYLIPDERTGKLRPAGFLMSEKTAAEYPGAVKADEKPAEWRDLPERSDGPGWAGRFGQKR